MLVRVDIPEDPNAEATVVSEDGKMRMSASSALLVRRLAKGERKAYFDATLEHGVLELGDRKPDLGW